MSEARLEGAAAPPPPLLAHRFVGKNLCKSSHCEQSTLQVSSKPHSGRAIPQRRCNSRGRPAWRRDLPGPCAAPRARGPAASASPRWSALAGAPRKPPCKSRRSLPERGGPQRLQSRHPVAEKVRLRLQGDRCFNFYLEGSEGGREVGLRRICLRAALHRGCAIFTFMVSFYSCLFKTLFKKRQLRLQNIPPGF